MCVFNTLCIGAYKCNHIPLPSKPVYHPSPYQELEVDAVRADSSGSYFRVKVLIFDKSLKLSKESITKRTKVELSQGNFHLL